MTRRLIVLAAVVVLSAPAWAQTSSGQTRSAGKRPVSTAALLNQRLPEVRFVETPLDQVIEWLAEFTQMNVVVRWETIVDAGVERDAPVSLQVRNLRLSQVLWLIMNEAAGSDLVLAYRASGNLLILSTEEDLGREMITKVYDVSDLLVRPPQTGRPDYQQSNQGLGQQSGGGGGQSIFGQGQQQNTQQQEPGQDVQIEELVTLIKNTVEPDSWDTGAGKGSISVFGSLLIVRNTILVHQQLGGYLTDKEVVVGR